jgi:hypothetical protein
MTWLPVAVKLWALPVGKDGNGGGQWGESLLAIWSPVAVKRWTLPVSKDEDGGGRAGDGDRDGDGVVVFCRIKLYGLS